MKKLYAVPEYIVNSSVPSNVYEHLMVIEPQDAYKYMHNRPTMSELAKETGLKNFDVALPIDWVWEFKEKTGFNPVGHFVMDYSDNSFGLTKPITREGEIAFRIYNHVSGKIKL